MKEEKKPHTPGVKGLMVGTTNIQKSNNIRNSNELIRNSLIGNSILNPIKKKSVFNTQLLSEYLLQAKEKPPQRKLIGSFIYEKEQTIMFSATGLGKSILAMQIALAASKGENLDLGNSVILKNEVGVINTIYFDFEHSELQLLKRMGDIEIPKNLTISKVERGQILSEKPLEIFALIEGQAKLVKAKFIIIDNMSKIGYDLEKTENAKQFMSALWDLVRFEDYTILIIAHPAKIDRKLPITPDSLGGSSKLGQLADSLIGINEVNSEEGNQVYIIQLKNRNEEIKYGQGNVICTKIDEDSLGFVRHFCYTTCSEHHALKGIQFNYKNYEKKMHATASYFYYGSYDLASEGTGIPSSTLKQRVKFLKKDFLDDYIRFEKMSKKDLKDQIRFYFDENDINNQAVNQ